MMSADKIGDGISANNQISLKISLERRLNSLLLQKYLFHKNRLCVLHLLKRSTNAPATSTLLLSNYFQLHNLLYNFLRRYLFYLNKFSLFEFSEFEYKMSKWFFLLTISPSVLFRFFERWARSLRFNGLLRIGWTELGIDFDLSQSSFRVS